MTRVGVLTGMALVCAVASAGAQSLNTFGNVGLIDMPEAGTLPDGTVAFTYGAVGASGRATVNFQLAPRIEGSLRYSSIEGWDGAGIGRSDRQFDLKVTLLEETDTRPAVAVGIRDFLGSGIYSSEYLVASKEVMPGLRLTGGLGWGRLASRAAFDNPFGGVRGNVPGGAEQVNVDNFFAGPDVGVFGGLAWTPEGSKWRLKVEYSSDTYAGESAFGAHRASSPWSFGVERQIFDGVDAGLYAVNGDEIGFRISFAADPRKPRVPPDLLSGPQPFIGRPASAKGGTKWVSNTALQDKIMIAIAEALAAEGLEVDAATLSAERAHFEVVNTTYDRPAKAVGRVARVLAAGMPASIETFEITLIENGLPAATVVVPRTDMEALVDTHAAVPESWRRFAIRDASAVPSPTWRSEKFPAFSWAVVPKVPFSLFGDDLDFDILVKGEATFQVNRSFSINGEVTQSVLGRLGDVTPPAGPLPRVRSNFAAYQNNGPSIDRLSADYVTKLGPSLYGRASAGYLERMFAGVSGEVLWKPVDTPVSLGLELNYVAQREPGSLLGVNGYEVMTGHGSVYWDTGWNGVYTQLDVGRYLAGDWGATVTVSRRFENGWEVSGYVTQTNADTSGSSTGSFDKGIRLTIPLSWTMPGAGRRKLNVPFADLARDDGARLDIPNRLYRQVRDVDRARLAENWGAFWQ